LKHRNLVLADILFLELNSPLREEDLYGPARWSARLHEYDNALQTHHNLVHLDSTGSVRDLKFAH
jgi:hypothetical protein